MKSERFSYTRKEEYIEINVHAEKTKKVVFIFFVTVGTVIPSIPLIIFVFSIVEKFDFGFGFVASFLVTAMVSFYLFKVAFWNMYGVEKYYISKHSVTFIADYKFFKDTVMTLEGQVILFGYFDERNANDENPATAKLIFWMENKQIQSSVDLSIDDIIKIIDVIDETKFLNIEQ